MTYLGIDLGTSEVKAVLTDDDSTVLGSSGTRMDAQSPHAMWSEQSPEAWWTATVTSVNALREKFAGAFKEVKAIGVSGQMHGATLLDAHGNVLRPAILWNDTRAFAECEELEANEPRSRVITGNLAMPGFTAPKLMWVARHEPAVFRATKKVLLPKDYLLWRLSGEFVSEMSDASGTLWLDVEKRDWSDRMLAATGLTRDHMPRLVEGSSVAGRLRADLRQEWGFAGEVVLCGGAGDNAASAIGLGVCQPGSGFLSLGTSGVLFAGTDRFMPNAEQGVHAFCHCLPRRWHQMSVILSAAASLEWLSRVLGVSVAELSLRAMQSIPAAAPLFLPYLSGERTPHNDANARGVFFGLTSSHSAADLAYSVMEGVAFAMADGYAALQSAGSRLDAVSFIGGGSRSGFWAELCATATGIVVRRHQGGDLGAAIGAARLARLASSSESVDEVCVPPPTTEVYEPNRGLKPLLEERLFRFRNIYEQLKKVFATSL
ncbi:xylulokinase [Paraburkholderia sp. 1N]|uniref:Xylulose kinase n=1 Tax=Paraburkholderia solitsugae TaxID=2675748 RepID=A0ABX2BV64_9BURK|nr:xylulokinase [Paraburkholderia solitsugae]NPT43467.1 xylulokinase [Paraburkholderia solitsugae]